MPEAGWPRVEFMHCGATAPMHQRLTYRVFEAFPSPAACLHSTPLLFWRGVFGNLKQKVAGRDGEGARESSSARGAPSLRGATSREI